MHTDKQTLILLRGGGDLASGIALRLHRAGIKLVITELAQPLAVRRSVSFAEAVYDGKHTIEGVTARLAKPDELSSVLEVDEIPVLVDPNAEILLFSFFFPIVIDGRLLKTMSPALPRDVPLLIGLGPGFQAGVNCHAAIETRRSHTLGRVYWNGATQADSGQPEGDPRRVLRAPADGILIGHKKISEHCESGDLIAEIQSEFVNQESKVEDHKSEIVSPFKGVLRGLIHDGIYVTKGLKIGDIDLRNDPSACFLVSDKALSIGGAVLEAMLTRPEIRGILWK
jgi:xanthine dehydrogenase accessory factor